MTLARMTTFAAVLALGTAQFAIAQETENSAPAENAAEPADDLSLGEPADQVGRPYIKEVVKDWSLRCIKGQSADEDERCQMYQLLKDDQDAPIVEVSIFKLPEGGRALAGATVVAPLETALQQQLTIQVDSGQARKYPFAFCNPVGCYARIGFTAEDVASFKRGNAAKVTIYPFVAPDQKVELNMSLSGFTDAFDKASTLTQ